MASLIGKLLVPMASSFFKKAVVPAVSGGVKSFFSKAPSLSGVSDFMGKSSNIASDVLSSELVNALANNLQGGNRVLGMAQDGLKGLSKAKYYTDEVNNILEKVKSTAPKVKSPPPPRVSAPPARAPALAPSGMSRAERASFAGFQ